MGKKKNSKSSKPIKDEFKDPDDSVYKLDLKTFEKYNSGFIAGLNEQFPLGSKLLYTLCEANTEILSLVLAGDYKEKFEKVLAARVISPEEYINHIMNLNEPMSRALGRYPPVIENFWTRKCGDDVFDKYWYKPKSENGKLIIDEETTGYVFFREFHGKFYYSEGELEFLECCEVELKYFIKKGDIRRFLSTVVNTIIRILDVINISSSTQHKLISLGKEVTKYLDNNRGLADLSRVYADTKDTDTDEFEEVLNEFEQDTYASKFRDDELAEAMRKKELVKAGNKKPAISHEDAYANKFRNQLAEAIRKRGLAKDMNELLAMPDEEDELKDNNSISEDDVQPDLFKNTSANTSTKMSIKLNRSLETSSLDGISDSLRENLDRLVDYSQEQNNVIARKNKRIEFLEDELTRLRKSPSVRRPQQEDKAHYWS